MAEGAGIPTSIVARLSSNILIELLLTLPLPFVGVLLSWLNAASTRNLGVLGSYLLKRASDAEQTRARLGAAASIGSTQIVRPDVVQLRDLSATSASTERPPVLVQTQPARQQTMGVRAVAVV